MQNIDLAIILAVADWFVDRVADRVVRQLEAKHARSDFADAKNNPLGSARAFLDAARRRDFPSFKRGRNVVALWADVEAYVLSRKRPAREPTPASTEDDDTRLLEGAGVHLRGFRPASDAGNGSRRLHPRRVAGGAR